MEKAGVEYLVEYPFNERVARMAPEEFVKRILVGQMNARAIVVGTDWDSVISGQEMTFLKNWLLNSASSLRLWKSPGG